jgi:hypothetical protein
LIAAAEDGVLGEAHALGWEGDCGNGKNKTDRRGRRTEGAAAAKFPTKFATKFGMEVAAKVLEKDLASVGCRGLPWAGAKFPTRLATRFREGER